MSTCSIKLAIFCSLLLFSSGIIKAQEFQISDIYAIHFSLNRKTQIVYLEDAVYSTIYEYDVKTRQTVVSKFTSIPFFANKKHLAVFANESGTYFYDFLKDSTYRIEGVHVSIINMYTPDIFSPNDSGFVATAAYDGPYYYYSFSRNKLFYPFPRGLHWESPPPSWSSNTTMMALSTYRDAIVNINLLTGKIDTVFSALMSTKSILYFNYEPGSDFVTYSYAHEEDYSPKIRRFYFNERKDSIVYDFNTENPASHCKGSPFGFTSMKWSSDLKNFSFIGNFYTLPASSIYNYFIDNNKTYLYGVCDEYGRKRDLQWLNNDTVIYANYSLYEIYAYDILSPIKTSVEERKLQVWGLILINYPNPFNAATILNYTLPKSMKVTLTVYDILGGEIITLVDEEKAAGSYEVMFDASGLSSGVYLYKLTTPENILTGKMSVVK